MESSTSIRDNAVKIWNAGVAAVHAGTLVKNCVSIERGTLKIRDQEFSIEALNRIVVVGFGKASGAMALGLEQSLREIANEITISGLVSVPEDQVVNTNWIQTIATRPVGENLPTPRVVSATKEILQLVKSAAPKDLIVCLISGGGSALLELPNEPISVDELRTATSYLSNSGCSIYELNAVRSAISQVKGGRLARAANGTPMVSLILSDVVGDSLDVIASGPTANPISQLSALDVLLKFDPNRESIPQSIWNCVHSNSRVEFTSHSTGISNNISNLVIGNIETAIAASQQRAIELGYACSIVPPSGNEGDAAAVGSQIPKLIQEQLSKPNKQCIIVGGETTVRLCEAPGQGGRNQHLVLSAISSMIDFDQPLSGTYCLLSGGTDGEDGNVSVAGALLDDRLIENVSGLTDSIQSSLKHCDSHSFHAENGGLLVSKKTWTNVCDLRILLTEPA